MMVHVSQDHSAPFVAFWSAGVPACLPKGTRTPGRQADALSLRSVVLHLGCSIFAEGGRGPLGE